MARQRFRCGLLVYLRFVDHVESSCELLVAELCGRIVEVHRTHLVVAAWREFGDDLDDLSNATYWSISRKDIQEARPLLFGEPIIPLKSREES